MNSSIVIIDDEDAFLRSIKRSLCVSGFTNIRTQSDPQHAATLLQQQGLACDIALIDISMPTLNGMDLLDLIKQHEPETECIMLTAFRDVKTAVHCMKKGAYDYLVKPVSNDELIVTIQNALEKQRLRRIVSLKKDPRFPILQRPEVFKAIVTQSETMLRLLREAELHAGSDVPILITGETGVGKELLARAIHAASDRAGFPYTPINMASHTNGLFDAEFFGHVKGAFTGAEKTRPGYLEATRRGTLVLDEIGILPYELQGRLLRVLQEGEYMKLGKDSPQTIDVRVIAVTNEDLEYKVQQGTFRNDLYYRLKGAWLHLPPLRERPEDIPLLVQTFLEKYGKGDTPVYLDDGVIQTLMAYSYPGNVRELEHIIRGAINLAQDHCITPHELPQQLQRLNERRRPTYRASALTFPPNIIALADVEQAHILNVYEHTGRNKTRTAQLLGIALNTLRKRLKEYGMS